MRYAYSDVPILLYFSLSLSNSSIISRCRILLNFLAKDSLTINVLSSAILSSNPEFFCAFRARRILFMLSILLVFNGLFPCSLFKRQRSDGARLSAYARRDAGFVDKCRLRCLLLPKHFKKSIQKI